MYASRLLRRACAITICSLIAVTAASSVATTASSAVMNSSVDSLGAPTTVHRPDTTFTPADRHLAMAKANEERGAAAEWLRLGGKETLIVKDVVRDSDGTQHVRYNRQYAGLPVIGGDLIVTETPQGEPQTVIYASPDEIVVPSIDASVSASTATSDAARRSGLRAEVGSSSKVVYASGHRPVLAWQTTVIGTQSDGTPIRDLVYADARTGIQLARLPQVMDANGTGRSLHSGRVRIQTVEGPSNFRLTDSIRGWHKTYDADNSDIDGRGTLFTDADNFWGNGTSSNRSTAGVDAAYGAAMTWDMYKSRFGRTGIRNDGVGAYSRVHFGHRYENAFWQDSCFCMTYGDGGDFFRPLTSLDVAGHEMSHGLTSATAGLNYWDDAGGLNEATSDVMGSMVEFSTANPNDPGDYYIGEKIIRGGGALRRMDNPSLDGESRNCWTPHVGDLDPHYSSGVGNHLFYLLGEGTGSKTIGGRAHSSTTCNGTSLVGIGRTAAVAIWYRALSTYWTSTTTYPQAANGMVRAAKDLYGADSSQCTATRNAWKGVNITPTQACGIPAR